MAGIFVASYTVSVRERQTADDLPLGFSQGASVLKAVQQTLTELKAACKKIDTARFVMRIVDLKTDTTGIWGRIECGEYGYSAKGIDSDTFEPSYQRKARDAELIPLYFRFHLPDNSETGILIVQRLGVHSVYTELKNVLIDRFNDLHPKHILRFGRVVPEQVLKALREGKVMEMTLVTRGISADIADRVRLKGSKKHVSQVTIRVTAKQGESLWTSDPSWMRRLKAGQVKVAELFGEDATSVDLYVDYRGRKRKYRVEMMDAAVPYLDITDHVELKRDGHPTFESIDEYCIQLRDELIIQLGGELN